MYQARILSALTVMACLAGCSRLSDGQALREFKEAFPDVTVNEQFVGEGDSGAAYMHFRYTTPAGERLERVWIYLRQKDGSWRATHKSEPKPPRSDFGD